MARVILWRLRLRVFFLSVVPGVLLTPPPLQLSMSCMLFSSSSTMLSYNTVNTDKPKGPVQNRRKKKCYIFVENVITKGASNYSPTNNPCRPNTATPKYKAKVVKYGLLIRFKCLLADITVVSTLLAPTKWHTNNAQNLQSPKKTNITIQGRLTNRPTKVENNWVNDNKKVIRQARPAPGSPRTVITNNWCEAYRLDSDKGTNRTPCKERKKRKWRKCKRKSTVKDNKNQNKNRKGAFKQQQGWIQTYLQMPVSNYLWWFEFFSDHVCFSTMPLDTTAKQQRAIHPHRWWAVCLKIKRTPQWWPTFLSLNPQFATQRELNWLYLPRYHHQHLLFLLKCHWQWHCVQISTCMYPQKGPTQIRARTRQTIHPFLVSLLLSLVSLVSLVSLLVSLLLYIRFLLSPQPVLHCTRLLPEWKKNWKHILGLKKIKAQWK